MELRETKISRKVGSFFVYLRKNRVAAVVSGIFLLLLLVYLLIINPQNIDITQRIRLINDRKVFALFGWLPPFLLYAPWLAVLYVIHHYATSWFQSYSFWYFLAIKFLAFAPLVYFWFRLGEDISGGLGTLAAGMYQLFGYALMIILPLVLEIFSYSYSQYKGKKLYNKNWLLMLLALFVIMVSAQTIHSNVKGIQKCGTPRCKNLADFDKVLDRMPTQVDDEYEDRDEFSMACRKLLNPLWNVDVGRRCEIGQKNSGEDFLLVAFDHGGIRGDEVARFALAFNDESLCREAEEYESKCREIYNKAKSGMDIEPLYYEEYYSGALDYLMRLFGTPIFLFRSIFT